MIEYLTTRHAYIAFALVLCIGIYMVIASPNLVKKLIGLNLFQTGVFLFLVAAAYVEGGAVPLVPPDGTGGPFVSPLPHVLVLTAIVVGVSLTAVGLALTIRIYSEYGTLRTDVLQEMLREERMGESVAAPDGGSVTAAGIEDTPAGGDNSAGGDDSASGDGSAGDTAPGGESP